MTLRVINEIFKEKSAKDSNRIPLFVTHNRHCVRNTLKKLEYSSL